MNQATMERFQSILDEHEAEITLLRILVLAFIDETSDRKQVAANFLRKVESYCSTAPHGTDPEYLVEVRARLHFYVRLLTEN